MNLLLEEQPWRRDETSRSSARGCSPFDFVLRTSLRAGPWAGHLPVGRQVLEETADQFGGSQGQGSALAGGAVPIRPEQLAIGTLDQAPIPGGGLEDIAAQF